MGAAVDFELAVVRATYSLEVGCDGLVHNVPSHPVVLERDCLNVAGGRMDHEVPRKVCVVVRCENRTLAGVEIEPREGGGVPAAAVRHVQGSAGDVHSERVGRHPVFQVYLHEG